MRGYPPDPRGASDQTFISRVAAARGLSAPSTGQQQSIWELYTDSVTRPESNLQSERLRNFTWRLRHSQALFAWHKQQQAAQTHTRETGTATVITGTTGTRTVHSDGPATGQARQCLEDRPLDERGARSSQQLLKGGCEQAALRPIAPKPHSERSRFIAAQEPPHKPPDAGGANAPQWLPASMQQAPEPQLAAMESVDMQMNDWQMGSDLARPLSGSVPSDTFQDSDPASAFGAPDFFGDHIFSPGGFQLDNVPLAFNGLEDPGSWISSATGAASTDATSNDTLIDAALQSGDFSLQPLQMYNFFDTQELLPSLPEDVLASDVRPGASLGDYDDLRVDDRMEVKGLSTAPSTRTSSVSSSRRPSMAASGIVSKPLFRKKKLARSPSSSVVSQVKVNGNGAIPAAAPAAVATPSAAATPGESPQPSIGDAALASRGDREEQARAAETLQCSNCTTFTTPLWRRDDQGNALCNACGLFFKLHGVNRPMKLKTDVIKRRNRQGPEDLPPAPRRRTRRRTAAERTRPPPIAPTPPKMSPSSRMPSVEAPAEQLPASVDPSRDSSSLSPNTMHGNEQTPATELDAKSVGYARHLGVSAGALEEQRTVVLDPVRDVTWMWPSLMQ